MSLARTMGGSAVLLSIALACSGGDGGDDGSGGAGGCGAESGNVEPNGTQAGWWCRCNSCLSAGYPDNTLTQAEIEQRCVSLCDDQGGVLGVTPRYTTVGTPECTAFCEKIDSLGCPGSSCASNLDFRCGVSDTSCTEATRAKLQCLVDQGVFKCTSNGWEYSTGGCSDFEELCK